jgi:hypothetical protein
VGGAGLATAEMDDPNEKPERRIIPFPNSRPLQKSCPPDDFCTRNARRLNQERNFLIDAQALTIAGKDSETLIAINNGIIQFNREVASHNRLCPQLPVLFLPTLGQQGLL